MTRTSRPFGQAALRGLALFFLSFLLLQSPLLVPKARAGNFSVSPVRVHLSQDQRVAALRVHNSGTQPASIQLQLLDWDQEAGERILVPTSDLLATPPIFTLPPGESQVVRVGLRRPPDKEKELTYRLFLEEIPPPLPDGFTGLRMALRLSVPVFVAPASGPAAPQLEWRAAPSLDGGLLLEAANRGNGHARIGELRLQAAGQHLRPDINDYVLAGKRRQWRLPSAPELDSTTTLELTAIVNGQEIQHGLELE